MLIPITGMKPQSPENSGETYSAAELPVRQAGLRGIKPSAFGGMTPFGREKVVRLTPDNYRGQCTAFLKFESHE
jgi:hypothetical protein